MSENLDGQIPLVHYDEMTIIRNTFNVLQSLHSSREVPLVAYRLDLPDEKEVLGDQTWWRQVENTCSTHAVVNAQLALGIQPLPNDVSSYYKGGQGYADVQRVITDQDSSIDMVLSLQTIKGAANPTRFGGKRAYDGKITLTPEDITNNATLIRDLIRKKKIPLVVVDGDELLNALEGSRQAPKRSFSGNHAVPIVGYRIKDKQMSVLLLESNDGPVWVGVDYLSDIIAQDSQTFLLYQQE